MVQHTSNIGKLLKSAYDNEELSLFCYDHFREVYELFTAGMGRLVKVELLLRYCERYYRFGELLRLTEDQKPDLYARFFSPSDENSNLDKKQLELKLALELGNLERKQQSKLVRAFISALADALYISSDLIEVIKIFSRTAVLHVELPANAVNHLLALDKTNDVILQDLGLLRVDLIAEYVTQVSEIQRADAPPAAGQYIDEWSQVRSLTHGMAMVVTDIHGDWDTYQRYRDIFVRKHEAGDFQYLILTGDLIHRESLPKYDKSLEIVLDVIELQRLYGNQVIYLCGNHELPHIYSVTLAKGNFNYTPSFEARMGEHRTKIINLFKTLPFFVRTAAGVTITHAGAAATFSDLEQCQRIFNFDHQDIFDSVDKILDDKDIESLRNAMAKFSREPYHVQVKNYLSVSDRNDPRYDDLLRGFIASSDPTFGLLWSTLFTRCEKEFGEDDYAIFLNALLTSLSTNFQPQNFLVAGHINVRNGYKVVTQRHLRMASGKHAQPPRSARYLSFDTAKRVTFIEELVGQLHSVY